MARRARITRLEYYDKTERLIAVGNDMRSTMQQVVDAIADDARPDAPKSAGAGHARGQHGADTIRGEVVAVAEGWRGLVGWPRQSYYLYMHEKGWVHKSPRPFLRPAAERRREL
jgi:hypothetical protein